ncbi:MAG: phosphotransferase family protein [Coriobacteriia bacterium]
MITPSDADRYLRESRPLREVLAIPEGARLTSTPIGEGEYNANFRFAHPVTGEPFVLRMNCGSQMHLPDQIVYEFDALKLLEPSGRTPRAYFVDDSRTLLPYGVLVMQFLPGRPLVYETDLALAAEILADVHSVAVPADSRLVCPPDPLRAILEECRALFGVYEASRYAAEETVVRLERLLAKAERRSEASGTVPASARRIVSTELNSGNFLINDPDGPNYLIDWEKPILGEVAQDLAHFLAPTTTLWKTETLLTRAEMERFLGLYRVAVGRRFDTSGLEERFEQYLSVTCLRGITWCSMAYVEYQAPDRLLRNESTYAKIKLYLSDEFLGRIEAEYFG